MLVPQLLDIGAGEFLALVVIAVILFGPEKIPELARKAGRVVRYLRGVANSATSQLADELGPEYSDLKPSDLNPKRFVQEHVLADVQADLDEIKSDLAEVKVELNETSQLATAAVSETVRPQPTAEPLVDAHSDLDATPPPDAELSAAIAHTLESSTPDAEPTPGETA